MGNRIIKESICTSDSIEGLTWFEECFFYRLIVNVDDYGRLDARAAILRAKLFPLKDGITDKQIGDALNKLSTAGMVRMYRYDLKPYLQLESWNSHQQIRNKKSKFPAPDMDCEKLQSIDINCNQLQSIAGPIQSNPIQSESNPNTNSNTNPPPLPPVNGGRDADGDRKTIDACSATADKMGKTGKTTDTPQGKTADTPQGKTTDTPQGKTADPPTSFEAFWASYPRKIGKIAALKAWNRIKPNAELRKRIADAIQLAKRCEQWRRENGKFIPNPATWLNQGRWDDEPTPELSHEGRLARYDIEF
jgi:hypothetical protein